MPKAKTAPKTPAVSKAEVNARRMPDGEEKTLPLAGLTFDPKFQIRYVTYDEPTIEEYMELIKDGVELAKIRVVDTGEKLIVWDGFHTGEARRRLKLKDAQAIVTKGTAEDAAFFALRANSGRGLQRNSADCRKAVLTVLDTPELMARVEKTAAQFGGLNRSLAIATGVSKGLVSKVLNDRGKTVRGGKIVNLPADRDAKPAKPSRNGKPSKNGKPDTLDIPGTVDDGEEFEHSSQPVDVQKLEIAALEDGKLLKKFAEHVARLQIFTDNLAGRKVLGPIFKEKAKEAKLPFSQRKELKSVEGSAGGKDEVDVSEYWPVVDQILEVVEAIKVDASFQKNGKPAAK